MYKVNDRASEPISLLVLVNGKKLTMELDTGAAVSIISDKTRKSLFSELKLNESSLILKTYTDEQMKVIGQLNVRVKYGDQEEKLVLVVVGGDGPSLFGHNWLKYLRLDWGKIASLRTTHPNSVSCTTQTTSKVVQ